MLVTVNIWNHENKMNEYEGLFSVNTAKMMSITWTNKNNFYVTGFRFFFLSKFAMKVNK